MKRPEILEHIPAGFSIYVSSCGIKDNTLDLGVVYSEVPAAAAAMFTRNKVVGNPILVGREHIASGTLQAIVVNSKNSNVATGKQGYKDSVEICKKTAKELSLKTNDVLPSSTGVIGRPLPVDKILIDLEGLSEKLKSGNSFQDFAAAIMTTDTFPKFGSRKIGNASLVGVAKGSGMIEPDMATMLSYFFTDAKISPKKLNEMLKRVVEKTYNSLSIDSDTSTSDTVAILANGKVGKVDENEFESALYDLALELTRYLAFDAEGATKLFVVDVEGAASNKEAKKIAKSIINSPLVKTAIYQGDPNWGRIFMAVGKTEGVKIDPDKIHIFWGNPPKEYSDLSELSSYLKQNEELLLTVKLGIGDGDWRVYGCDLTEEYVHINAFYTT